MQVDRKTKKILLSTNIFGLSVETKVKFMRYMNTYQVKFITQSSHLTEATFDRHLEVIVTDLHCGAAANSISKVKIN